MDRTSSKQESEGAGAGIAGQWSAIFRHHGRINSRILVSDTPISILGTNNNEKEERSFKFKLKLF